MLKTNTNLQTQTSNALHNVIMEACGKDRPPMLAPGIDNDIYSIVDACPNSCDMWKAIKRLKQGESINVQDLETNLYLEFGKFTSRDGESLESYYSRFVTLVKQSQELKTVSYHKLYDILKQHQNEFNEIRAERLARTANPLVLIQEGTQNVADNSRPIFDVEPLQKVQNNDDNYNVYANDQEHPVQPEFVNDTYLEEQGDTNITIDSLDMSINGETVDHDDDDLAKERDLLASLIEKLKCEIDDSKNRNKFLESSNKILIDKLKDLKKFQAELDRYHDVNYASKVEINCAKDKGDFVSYKMESQKSFNKDTRKINDLNQTISEMKKELCAHQETISIMSKEKEAQKKFHKTREDKELEKVISLENKIKVLDDIVYKTGQSVQLMNMLNRNYKTSFVKLEFLKKAQRANPCLYDIGCYNDNFALMLGPESDEMIRLAQESRSKLSDLIKPFDYENLNNLYDLFVPQREKSSEQRYFS
ncbi:hypothetical protein Tco_1214041 [Tanacetum coccineum]